MRDYDGMIRECDTVGDWWGRMADAGDNDARETLARIDQHVAARRASLLDCDMCGEYFTDCQCGNLVMVKEVNNEH